MIQNELAKFGEGEPCIGKYSNYFDLYEEIFKKINGPVRLLEIGIRHGGSIELWRRVLPLGSEIVGIDIMPKTKQFISESVQIVIGDQSDSAFLSEFSRNNGLFDIIIDDGSHISSHQIKSFEVLFAKNLRDGGYYIIEDVHTSYWRDYGGGFRRKNSCIEFMKRLIEDINAWHGTGLEPSVYTRSVRRISFESSLVILEKATITAPVSLQFGGKMIDFQSVQDNSFIGKLYNVVRMNRRLKNILRRMPLTWWIANRVIRRND